MTRRSARNNGLITPTPNPVDGVTVRVSALRIETDGRGNGGSSTIVDGVSFEVGAGKILGLVGESGCGKTTVGLALLGYVRSGARWTAGEVSIGTHNLSTLDARQLRRIRGGDVAYVPQDPASALNPAIRVDAQIEEVLLTHRPECSKGERAERVREVAQELGLAPGSGILHRYPHELSGGQQQRIGLAMAFVCRPSLIVCDEPTTGLDVTTQAQVLATLAKLTRRHKTACVYISHDLAVVAGICDDVAVMYAGSLVEAAPTAALFEAARHPYTQGLMAAVPSVRTRSLPLGIPGHAPTPGHKPSGCSFSDRCAAAQPDCTTSAPPLTSLTTLTGDHHIACFHPAIRPRTATSRVATDAPNDGPRPIALAVTGLTAAHGARQVLTNIDLRLQQGECVALVGESGSGKSTLAKCIIGLHTEQQSEIHLYGQRLDPAVARRSRSQRGDLQYVFQNPYGSLNPRSTVGEILTRQTRLLLPLRGQAVQRHVSELLEQVALPTVMSSRYSSELSGGQRQRVALARALASNPKVLVCDEITSALDVSIQASILALIEKLRSERDLAVLFITHNLSVARSLSSSVVVMREGTIVEQGPTEMLLNTPRSDYARTLLEQTPDLDGVGQLTRRGTSLDERRVDRELERTQMVSGLAL